ncbi:hypothetical protein CANCADRAFT_31146 [Tortispora caseinolytica NRRL Y-17796]|uniref:SHSP domain-containing protein n=1 Tax=Tortispora caseinolytica NRRL Y-17796 TaxID=767744 RepID=A0A1E4TE77_9ASCO|nr:hypothetical protein CANCADRAFT_31146 [Tortispora caseinolytica NRRL Y-17796]
MSVTRTPFWELVESAFDDAFTQRALGLPNEVGFPRKAYKRSATDAAAIPPIDVYDNSENYLVHADIPGVDPSNINATFDPVKHELKVTAEVSDKKEENRENLKVSERWVGRYERTVRLPAEPGVDADKITASFNNGVLELTVPKKETQEKKPVTIAIGKPSL